MKRVPIQKQSYASNMHKQIKMKACNLDKFTKSFNSCHADLKAYLMLGIVIFGIEVKSVQKFGYYRNRNENDLELFWDYYDK